MILKVWGRGLGKCEKMDHQRRGQGSKGQVQPPRARKVKPLGSLPQLGILPEPDVCWLQGQGGGQGRGDVAGLGVVLRGG